MKLHKLFLSAATVGLLLGGSGAAMAQVVDDCADGFIIGEQVDEIQIDGVACHIEEVLVNGNVTVTNSPALTMIDVEVKGSVSATGPAGQTGRVSMTRVDSFGGNIDVTGHAGAIVSACITRGGGEAADNGNMTVSNNTGAIIYSNVVVGDLTCTGNTQQDAFFNRVYGTENCPDL